MDDEADFKAESWALVGGGCSLALTHIPTGLRVDDPGPSEASLFARWSELRVRLKSLVEGRSIP